MAVELRPQGGQTSEEQGGRHGERPRREGSSLRRPRGRPKPGARSADQRHCAVRRCRRTPPGETRRAAVGTLRGRSRPASRSVPEVMARSAVAQSPASGHHHVEGRGTGELVDVERRLGAAGERGVVGLKPVNVPRYTGVPTGAWPDRSGPSLVCQTRSSEAAVVVVVDPGRVGGGRGRGGHPGRGRPSVLVGRPPGAVVLTAGAAVVVVDRAGSGGAVVGPARVLVGGPARRGPRPWPGRCRRCRGPRCPHQRCRRSGPSGPPCRARAGPRRTSRATGPRPGTRSRPCR